MPEVWKEITKHRWERMSKSTRLVIQQYDNVSTLQRTSSGTHYSLYTQDLGEVLKYRASRRSREVLETYALELWP